MPEDPPSRRSLPPSRPSLIPPSVRNSIPPSVRNSIAPVAITVATAFTQGCAFNSSAPEDGDRASVTPPSSLSLRAPRLPGDLAGTAPALLLDDLDVTLGAVAEPRPSELRVDSPKMRAFSRSGLGDAAELAFEYQGQTDSVSRLSSGQVREQVGLKLRAEDGCNLVYVMWRISPVPELVVQLKRNEGAHTHAECGTDGYEVQRPRWKTAVPDLAPGDAHRLRAELRGEAMTVYVDDEPVWRGNVPGSSQLHGTVGVRTDNAKVRFELRRLDLAPKGT